MVDASAASSDRGHLEELLEELPALLHSFSAFDIADLDLAIDEVVARLGRTTGVDRAYVFQVDGPSDAPVLRNSHEWCAPGIAPQRDELQDVPMETIAPWRVSFEAHDIVYIPRVADLPPTRPDREVLQAQDIRSLVAAPLVAEGELIGFLGFDAVHGERSWTRAELLLLEVVADAVCSAVLRRRARDALATSERRYRLLARHSSDLVVTIGTDGRFVDISSSAAALLGWSLDDAHRSDPADHVHPGDWPALLEAITRNTDPTGSAITLPDFRLRHQDGSWRWLQGNAIDLTEEPSVGGLVVIGHDITDRKRAEAALSFQAVHDPLTGLANRTLLLDRLEHALTRCERHDRALALLFLDLDRFKVVNDALGHAAGDDLLCAYATRLRELVRSGDTVARFGGDEFVVVFEEIDDDAQAWAIAERLLEDLEAPFPVQGRGHRITASAGLVVARAGARAEELLREGDAAMYQAKARGRQRIVALDERVRRTLVEEADLARELQGMEQRGELALEYQPVFDLGTGRTVGYEALARWHHPERGRIAPNRFIPLAEDHGLIAEIGRVVLEQAVRQLQAWDARYIGHEDRTMAVNLSLRQLQDDRLVEDVADLLARTGLAPHRLELELTESALMTEPEAGRRALARLRELGVQLAIDDFGTGYSSLAYLRALPVTTLKVDQLFVSDLGRDRRAGRLVSVVLNLAEAFGLRSVAEGIETPEQRAELERLGFQLGQGFGLAVPAPPQLLEAQTFMPMARSSSRT